MNYSNNKHIKTVEDVKLFFRHLVNERQLNFHPDDDFTDYIDRKSQSLLFTKNEAKKYNKLMELCFDICKRENADIYEIGFKELSHAIGLNDNK